MISFDKAKEQILAQMDLLPAANYDLLKYLISFLTRVAAHSEENRMDTRNLALVFGASMINPHPDAPFTLMNVQYQNVLLQLLIDNYDILFERRTLTGARLPALQLGKLGNVNTIRAGIEDTVRVNRDSLVASGPVNLGNANTAQQRARAPLMALAQPNSHMDNESLITGADALPAPIASLDPPVSATTTTTDAAQGAAASDSARAAIVAAASVALGLSSGEDGSIETITTQVTRLPSESKCSSLVPVTVLISPR
jgi:hypothetical protein